MDASILQNPADPDATYRKKAGKQNRGYATNLSEACGEEGSIVTDYQYDTNTHSDAAFIKEAIQSAPDQEKKQSLLRMEPIAEKKSKMLRRKRRSR